MSISKQIKRKVARFSRQWFDAVAAAQLAKLDLPYLPSSDAALSPFALRTLVDEILINKRLSVVEFGAGVSTFYIGAALRQIGGALITFEENAAWAEKVSKDLHRLGLTDVVRVVHSERMQQTFGAVSTSWYGRDIVEAALPDSIDMVIVDGPVAYNQPDTLVRYPALPVVRAALSDRCAIYLDDVERSAETSILRRWGNELNVAPRVDILKSSLGALTIGAAFAVR